MKIERSNPDVVSSPIKLGARVVVDLLERHVCEVDFEQFEVLPQRSAEMQRTLLSNLTVLQHDIKDSPYTKASLKTIIHQQTAGVGSCVLSRLDLGTINLVDAMYDEMLEKGRFDTEAWALIAKTKIPVLKLITQDLSFLFSQRNIARKFLNNMALTLVSSPNSESDPARVALEGFVERIVNTYEVDVSAVNTVCIDAQTWFAGNQQRLEVVQEKIVRSESSKNRKIVAEPRVVDLINRYFSGTEQPDLMLEFVTGVWRSVLRTISIEDGEKSARWKRAVGLTESMATFYAACLDADGREKYQRFLPTMMKSVKLLIEGGVKDASVEEAIEPFELITSALVAGAIPGATPFETLVLESKVVDVYERKTKMVGGRGSLDELNVGDWVRMVTTRKTIEACKLTVKAEGEGVWIFINQSGKKIAKKTRVELEQGFSQGTLQLIGKGLWVDDFLAHAFFDLSNSKKIPMPVVSVVEEKVVNEDKISVENASLEKVSLEKEFIEKQSEELIPGPVERKQELEFGEAPDVNLPRVNSVKKDQEKTPDISDLVDDILISRGEDPTGEVINTGTEEASIEIREADVNKGGALDHLSSVAEYPAEVVGKDSDIPTRTPPSTSEIEAATRALDNLQAGGWIVVAQGAFDVCQDAEMRLKLAVVVKGGTKYIFVNRLGVKQLDIERHQFIEAIAFGDISIVDNGMQFSSALEKVVRTIQKEHR